jgi:hypothetical protein
MGLINIACVLRAGGKFGYDSSWVKKLENSVRRNLTIDHKFICLSDVEVPCQRIPLDPQGIGWWAKIQLFKPKLFDGPVLYFDLDTVLCNNIDDLVSTLLNQNNFLMERAKHNISSSAIMYWNGDYSQIYKKYIENPKYFEELFSKSPLIGDQALISTTVNYKFLDEVCPPDWFHIVNKKDDLLDLSKVKILIFRKKFKPSTLSEHKLVKKHWK